MEELLGKKIVFSKKTSNKWISDFPEMNIVFLKQLEKEFNARLRLFKYISWETMCLYLGLKCTAIEIENTTCIRYLDHDITMVVDNISEDSITFHYE